jgi:ketosteroid isomerase-like protein
MSQKNVEIAKRGIEAFNQRDLDVYDDLCTPDFEFLPAAPGVFEGEGAVAYRGREGIEAYRNRDSPNIWDEIRTIADEFRDLGDRVLVLGRLEARGRGSGVPVDAPMGIVIDFRDGKMSRARGFLDHGEALRAAGLAD